MGIWVWTKKKTTKTRTLDTRTRSDAEIAGWRYVTPLAADADRLAEFWHRRGIEAERIRLAKITQEPALTDFPGGGEESF